MSNTHRVVIIGGGFAGLETARNLRRAPVDIKLLDRRNFHLFQPLLYQVATGALSPADISAPLRSILKRHRNTQVLLAEVCEFDLPRRRVLLSDGHVEYDTLVVATGSTHHYFGNDQWAPLAPGLKTIEDATEIRRRLLLAFEAAERESDPQRRRQWLTFVIVGGGPTGVELAGALAEIARDTLRREFRSIDPSHAHIILIEGADRILPIYPGNLPEKAQHQLESLGVVVRSSTRVTEITPDCVTLQVGEEVETIPTRTVLWGAGVRASSLGPRLAKAAGVEADRGGRISVGPDLTVSGHPEIFVIGDLAHCDPEGKGPLPGVAPVAIQQGRYVAKLIRRRLAGGSLEPFTYHDFGSMATIGRNRAVAVLGSMKFSGLSAWIIWLLVHLGALIQFRNRIAVMSEWAYNYITYNRQARMITGPNPLPIPTLTESRKENE